MTGFGKIIFNADGRCCIVAVRPTFLPVVSGRKEVARVQKKAWKLLVCAVIVLYIFCIKAH